MSLPDRVREEASDTLVGGSDPTKGPAGKRAPQRLLVTPGTLVADKYRVVRLLGSGAMGQVFLARQELIERPVALKVLHPHLAPELAMAQRFHFEAVAASKIRHPNVAMIYDYGQFEGTLYLAMEFVEGETLMSTIRRLEKVPVRMVMDVAAQVVAALGAAHEQGVLHRDVKPQNILLRPEGGGLSTKVVDFGVAKLLDRPNSVLTQSGLVVGTPEYMAPEHAGGKTIDATADLYALGVVMFEMLEGRLPFVGRSRVETSVKHIKDPVPPLGAHVPPSLASLVTRLLEKKPQDRPQSAAEVIASLNRVAIVLDASAAPQPATEPIVDEVEVDERYRMTERLTQVGPTKADPPPATLPVTVQLPATPSAPLPVSLPVTQPVPAVSAGGPPLFATIAFVLLILGVVTLVTALVLFAVQ
jgi:serine/threonine protein kinase